MELTKRKSLPDEDINRAIEYLRKLPRVGGTFRDGTSCIRSNLRISWRYAKMLMRELERQEVISPKQPNGGRVFL